MFLPHPCAADLCEPDSLAQMLDAAALSLDLAPDEPLDDEPMSQVPDICVNKAFMPPAMPTDRAPTLDELLANITPTQPVGRRAASRMSTPVVVASRMNTPVASRMNTPLSHQIAVGLHSGVFVGETPPSAAGMLSSQHSVDSRISSRRLLSSSRSSCQPRASQLNTSHLSRLSGSQFSDGVDNDMTQDYAELLGDGQADYAALLGTQQVDLQAEGQVEELAQVFSQTVTHQTLSDSPLLL